MSEARTTTLAPLGRRFAARLIDGLLLVVVGFVLVVAFGDVRMSGGTYDVPGWAQWAMWLLAVTYEIVLVVSSGQTIGKRALGIRVADATTGAVPNLDQAVRRCVPTLLQQVPIISALAWVLYAPVLWNGRRQGMHDRLAGTVVVDLRAAPPEPPAPWASS
jgi:uncharacterized RDD family membrane protein YckC